MFLYEWVYCYKSVSNEFGFLLVIKLCGCLSILNKVLCVVVGWRVMNVVGVGKCDIV